MKSKKVILILFFLIILFGCGKEETNVEKEEQKVSKIIINNLDVTPGSVISLDKLQSGYEYSEIPSCAFSGLDKVYTYDNYEIVLGSVDGKYIIYSVYLFNPDVDTNSKINVSDSSENVFKELGNDYRKNGDEYIYSNDVYDTKIIIRNDLVISITYELKEK